MPVQPIADDAPPWRSKACPVELQPPGDSPAESQILYHNVFIYDTPRRPRVLLVTSQVFAPHPSFTGCWPVRRIGSPHFSGRRWFVEKSRCHVPRDTRSV